MQGGNKGHYEPFYIIWINGKELPENMLKNIKGFSFDDDDEKLDELRFTVLDPNMEFQDSPLLQKGAVVRAKWGYLGGLSESRECTIEEPEYNFPDNGVPEIVIKALDKGSNLVKSKPQKCYQNANGEEMIKEIANRHNLKPVVYIKEDFKVENAAQGVSSDFDFVRQIAIERGCLAWVENNELHVAPNEVGKAAMTLIYRRDGTGIVKSVKIKDHGTKGQAERTGTKVVGIDPVQKKPIDESTSQSTPSDDDVIDLDIG